MARSELIDVWAKWIALLADTKDELERQFGKWGVQSHAQAHWYAILGEEFGEVGKAICEIALSNTTDLTTENLREELIQVAAVALAAVESLDRTGFDGR